MKIVFMGTPDFSVNVLNGLIDNYDVSLVVTQPDKMVGRHKELKPTPVKVVALNNNIEVFQPTNIKEDYQRIIDMKPDMIVTCAYGQIIPKVLLDLPKYGCINVHASLLPKLRGGSPIHHAIIDGYDKSGVTIMYMVKKMDAGDIISVKETPITDEDNLESLHDRLSLIGTELLLETIPKIASGEINPIKQDESEVTYAWNIKREEELLDFNDTGRNIFNKIRGLSPIPGSFTYLDDKILKIYSSCLSDKIYNDKENGEIVNIYKDGIGVKVIDGEIIIKEIQLEGKKKMKVSDFLNGIDKSTLIGKVLRGTKDGIK